MLLLNLILSWKKNIYDLHTTDQHVLHLLLRQRKFSLQIWVIQGQFLFENLQEKIVMFREKVELEETV